MELKRVPYPRLLKDNGDFDRTIIPVSASINLCITPLSYASLDLPMHETIEERSYIELFTPFGSAGVFRVRSPSDTYGEGMITTAELEHAIVEVGDYVVRTKYDEMMAAGTAMQTIFSHYRGSRWQLGSVAAMGTGQIAVQADHVRVLEAMLALLDQCPSCMLSFDFSTTPWTVSVVSRGTVVAAEGRLSRNVNGARIIYDDTELCTRAYYEISSTGSGGEPSSTWTSMDADTINVYGVVERDVPAGTDLTPAEAQRVVTEYLRKHKHPRISVEINAEELSNITGEPWDTFTVGKLFRLSLPDYNKTVEQTVTAVAWGDVYSNPYDMTVSLAEEEDTAITFLHDLDAKGGSGGGGAAQKQTEKIIRENKTERESDRYSWEMVKQKTDRNGNILQQAGIELDPNGIIMYAEDNERQIAGKLKLTAESLTSDYTQKIGNTEAALQGTITQTASSLRSDYTDKINNTESHITQTADQIRAEVSDHVAGLNSSITQTAGQIRSELNDEVNNLTSSITQTASEIRSEVEDKEAGLKSEIKQTADAVEINAQNIRANASNISVNARKINVIAEDYVTINRLSTEMESIKQGYANSFTTTEFHGGTCTAVTLDTGALKVGNGGSAAWHTVSVDGTAVGKVLGDSDINFNRAGAYNEGKNSVTLSTQGWQSGGRNVVTASNGKTLTVNLPSFSSSGGTSFVGHKTTVYFSTGSVDGPLKSVEVDASSEYNQGAYDTYHGGNWERPSSSNEWACKIPNDSNSGKETWFNVADILPTPTFTWSNPAKGYAMVEFYICGKHYHTSKQIPGGWM